MMRLSKSIFFYCSLFVLLLILPLAYASTTEHTTTAHKTFVSKNYIEWLEKQSMLFNANKLATTISGSAIPCKHPFTEPQSKKFVKTASVWLNIYPESLITKPNQTLLSFLGENRFWKTLQLIGIQALHTGPLKLAGGIKGKQYTPSVDGYFDRISLSIDPKFGTDTDYQSMVKTAHQHHAIIIGDIIPGHTGKGADFLLAERNYKNYPGIYTLIEIKKSDWPLLPTASTPWSSANLTQQTVDTLTAKGYLPGRLQRVLFSLPHAKQPVTGWDASGIIKGVDGKDRRWVYLHYFKPGQPSLNWLDPSFGANRILAGDIVQTIHHLGAKAVRIDANSFLGIEKTPHCLTAWSENHPLSQQSTNSLAWLTRKLGGWTFQELNLSLEALENYSELGPDLSYDFITRPAVEHALLTGDATFLRFMLQLMMHYNIDPGKLIHDMQNHDEITYELVHLHRHAKEKFNYDNTEITGEELRHNIIDDMHQKAINTKTPYNQLSSNGLCTTLTGLVATRFNLTDIDHLTLKQKQHIQKGHFLLAIFNAMQPGVFSISGWDLVGALPLHVDQIKDRVTQGDYRWINRGAYDLMNNNKNANFAVSGLPKAKNIYGPINEQLKNPNSFTSRLQHLLKMRDQYQFQHATLIGAPTVKNKSLAVMAFELPNNLGYGITAINFGHSPIDEKINLHKIKGIHVAKWEGYRVIDLLPHKIHSLIKVHGYLKLHLEPLEGAVLVIKAK